MRAMPPKRARLFSIESSRPLPGEVAGLPKPATKVPLYTLSEWR
jgi:hypothetical protein